MKYLQVGKFVQGLMIFLFAMSTPVLWGQSPQPIESPGPTEDSEPIEENAQLIDSPEPIDNPEPTENSELMENSVPMENSETMESLQPMEDSQLTESPQSTDLSEADTTTSLEEEWQEQEGGEEVSEGRLLSAESEEISHGVYLGPFVSAFPRRSIGLGFGVGYRFHPLWEAEASYLRLGYNRGRVRYRAQEWGLDFRYYCNSPYFSHFFSVFGVNYQSYRESFHQGAQELMGIAPRGVVDRGVWGKAGAGVRFDYSFPYLTARALSVGGQVELNALMYQISEVSQDFHPLGGKFLGFRDVFMGVKFFLALVL